MTQYLDADDYRLWVGDGAGPEVFHEILGQKGINWGMSVGKVDRTTKSDIDEVARPSMRSYTMDCDLIPKLPDTTGYTRCEALCKTRAAGNFQIRKAGSAGVDPGDVVFAISAYVTSLGHSATAKADVAEKITLMPTGAPSANALA